MSVKLAGSRLGRHLALRPSVGSRTNGQDLSLAIRLAQVRSSVRCAIWKTLPNGSWSSSATTIATLAAGRHGRRWCGRRSAETLTSGPYAAPVGMVDPDDDSICRWVVSHFRYDPARNERRNVVVAAFDNPD